MNKAGINISVTNKEVTKDFAYSIAYQITEPGSFILNISCLWLKHRLIYSDE